MASAMAWVSGVGSPTVVESGGCTAQAECLDDPAGGDCGPGTKRDGPGESRGKPPEPSREFTRLVELRAYLIWDRVRPSHRSGR